MPRKWVVLVLATGLALAACTAPAGTANPQVSRPVSTAWKWLHTVRPDSVVRATLRQLDACALFDPSTMANAHLNVGDGTVPLHTTPLAPHECDYGVDTDDDNVDIQLGAVFQPVGETPRLAINGTLAYLDDTGTESGLCSVYLPVSSDLAIAVLATRGARSTSDPCAMARTTAAGAVGKLGNPATVKVDPAARPLAGWDACALLTGVLGSDTTPNGLSNVDSVDGCGVLGVAREVSVEYIRDPLAGAGPAPVVAVGAAKGTETGVGGGCAVSWSHGSTGILGYDHLVDPFHGTVVIQDIAPSCAQAVADGVVVQRLLAGAPPTATATQPPLLYPA